MCVTDLLCSTAETNNIVNQLYSNKIIFLEKPIPQKKKGGGWIAKCKLLYREWTSNKA